MAGARGFTSDLIDVAANDASHSRHDAPHTLEHARPLLLDDDAICTAEHDLHGAAEVHAVSRTVHVFKPNGRALDPGPERLKRSTQALFDAPPRFARQRHAATGRHGGILDSRAPATALRGLRGLDIAFAHLLEQAMNVP
jgi:hypothetical protein